MQSAKKSTKVLSALSMAAVSALAAKTVHGATLSMYYGQDAVYATSHNGTFVGTGFTRSSTTALTGTVTPAVVSNGGITTIVVPVGDYLSLALDAVLTGNANPYAGESTGQSGVVQPAFLGLNELGIAISSSDSTGTLLTPLAIQKGTAPDTTIDGLPSYTSTAAINQTLAGNSGQALTPAPIWPSKTGAGEIQPNLSGYDSAPNASGGVGFPSPSVGAAAFTAGGNTGPVSGANSSTFTQLTQFTVQNNTASYASATDFVDNISFLAKASGTVTLAPFAVSTSTEYWTATPNEISGTSGSPISYNATHFGTNDTIHNVPLLVIQIGTIQSVGHAVVSFTATGPASNYGVQITNGTGTNQGAFSPVGNALVVTGSHGSYTVSSVTGINGGSGATTDSVEATGFTAGDEEIFAVDVLVNGTQATAGQLATLVTAINAGGNGALPSTGVVASTQSPVPNPFGSAYNLFLDPLDIGGGTDWLGLDLSTSNDSALSGYTFGAVAVVPEPMTLGLLALGGVGLMARRHRRKA